MKNAPTYARGRRGGISIIDAIVQTLRRSRSKWPTRTFAELQRMVSAILGYAVSNSTIRSAIYGRIDLFDKHEVDGAAVWTLSAAARREQS